ncbi:MAG: chemotaxis protein CheA [Euryarchaeota archaeon]|nr:chemotaxis protein CheA [Euryarchaeota archaeon]
MESYKDVFISESMEHLNTLTQGLLELEKGNLQVISEIFRAAHTLKGMSATMGYEGMASITHEMENLLDAIREGRVKVTSELVDTLFEAVDLLEAALDALREGDEENIDAGEVSRKLSRFVDSAEEAPGSAAGAGQQDRDPAVAAMDGVKRVDIELDKDCTLKSVRAFMAFRELKELGEIVKCIPEEEKLEDGDFDRTFSIFLKTGAGDEEIKERILKKVSEVTRVEVTSVESSSGGKEKGRGGDMKSVQTVRVSIERLDSLMNLVGELVISKSRLFQIKNKYAIDELNETLAYIDKLTTSLQEEVQEMRMVEVRYVFDRFPRMVRDLAKKEGKKVEFVVEGKEIELDRTVLDEIGDPLVHLLRNCIDHGIEPPEERVEKGKSEVGRVLLRARRVKDHVEIVVEDDGRGIDPEKIKKVAVERGIISEKEAEGMSPEEARMLVFMPGFSSAEKVTDISGRGVGLDVVRNKILALGGTVELESEVDRGTRFVLKLPLTLAITKALLISAGGRTYAIPLNNVNEILNVRDEDITTVMGQEVIQLRGRILPVYDLLELLGKPTNGDRKRSRPVVVVEKGGNLLGLAVDELIGQQEIVIKGLDGKLRDVRGFAGSTIMGDGRVSLILDIASLEVG